MDLQSYNVVNISPEKFSEIEKRFFAHDFIGRDNKEAIFAELNKIFADISLGDIEQYRNTYWKLYVYACWDLINTRDEDFVEMMCERQILDALRLGIDVWESLISFMNLFELTEESRKDTYQRFKQAFFDSQMVVSPDGENIKTIIEDVLRIYRQGDDSLKNAEYATYISGIMFPEHKLYSKFAIVDSQEQQVKNFVGLIHFFFGVKATDISIVLDAYVNASIQEATQVTQDIITNTETTNIDSVTSELLQKPTEPPIAQLSQKSHYHDVQEELEIMFRYDSQGELQPIEDVLGKLTEFAQKYDDPHIEELYYFDEGEGKFVWNGDLL